MRGRRAAAIVPVAVGVAIALTATACSGSDSGADRSAAGSTVPGVAAPDGNVGAGSSPGPTASTAVASTETTAAAAPTSSPGPGTAVAPVATTAPDSNGSVGCATPPRAQPAADRPRYVASAAVDPAGGLVTGDVAVTFTPDAPIDRLVFRLWPNAPRNAAGGALLTVLAATVDGGFSSVETPNDTTLELGLSRPVAAGAAVTVSMRYRLVVGGAVRDRISRGEGWMRLGSFLPVLAWEPGRGWAREPATSGFAEAATSMAADYDVAVSVPEGYGVLGVGLPDPDGHWRAVAVRDMALSVGRFRTVSATVAAPGPVSVIVGVSDSLDDDPAAYLARIGDALVDFSHRFGPYPWPSLTVALTPELTGGIEYPSHVMQGSGSIGRTTPHEVGHQWFYGLVGNNQGRDPVLDEGLATYAEARHEDTLGSFVATGVPEGAAGRAGRPMTYWDDRLADYYSGVYVQGAQAVAALGPPELVDCALARYVASYAFQVATQADLVAAMQQVFPDAAAVLAGYGIGAG